MLTPNAINNITNTENYADCLSSRYQAVDTARGEVVIRGPVAGEILSCMRLSGQMDSFRPPDAQLRSLVYITGLPRGRVYIAHNNNTIVGYVTFHLPDSCSCWHSHPGIIELGGIEVAREWRSHHVAGTLLQFIFQDEFWEDFIIIGLECFRNWDLQSSGLNVWQYRSMMDRLIRQVNFYPCFTRMYDVLDHPANALVARRGTRVNPDDWQLFKKIARGQA